MTEAQIKLSGIHTRKPREIKTKYICETYSIALIEWDTTAGTEYSTHIKNDRGYDCGHYFSTLAADKKPVPKKAREIGLARQDVLRIWEEYRNNAEKRTSADKDFIVAYNAGVIGPELHKKLGIISKRTLYRWKNLLTENGNYEALIPAYNYGSTLVKDTELSEIEKKYFLDLMLQPRNIKIGSARRLIKYILEKQGVEVCSYSTYLRFANWFKKTHTDIWVLMREGQKALIDKVAPYVERDASLLEVGDVLVADGHVLDFQIQNPFNGKPCRAALVGYLDWKSAWLVGYEIMLTENTQCIASALRNSIINLGKIPKMTY